MNKQNTILLSTCKGLINIPFSEIIRVEALSNYSKLFFTNGKTLVVAKVLQWFQTNLPQQKFVRIHRSHLINMEHIKYSIFETKNEVTLIDNSHIEIARRKKASIRKLLAA